MSRKNSASYISLIPLLLVTICISSCNWTSEEVNAGNSEVVVVIPPNNQNSGSGTETPPVSNPETTVCNPFSGPSGENLSANHHGIYGKLKYLNDSMPRYSKVSDYFRYGVPVNADLFFSDLNVPTRSFSLGFSTQSGEVIKNHNGNTLYEYFSLHFQSQIKLSDSDPLGAYQFALLADDGSIMQINLGSGYQNLVDNDGTHSSRFKISSTPVVFESRNTSYPIKLDYYQGPRFHIALILLWRPWPSGSASDPSNGTSGNSLFFDWTQVPSVPTSTYNNILSRGWRPVAPANFILPPDIIENPCTGPITTSITQVSPAESSTSETQITFQFASNYSAATFKCSLDNSALVPCVSPQSYANLGAGAHQFSVFASTPSQSDSVGKHHTWTVLPPISTTITEVLPVESPTNSKSVSFGFASNYSGATFQCSLDGAAAAPCISPQVYDSLADGPHQFVVYSSAQGKSDTTGASYFWVIDSIAPQPSGISITPTSNSFTVIWSTNEPTTTRLNWGAGTATNIVVPEDTQLTTQHQITVTGLNAFTIYSVILGGRDQAGNSYQSSTFRVRTTQ